ncbi:MAG: hypothetical protein JW850_06500, partial [Thermoflexales bacterium]|nr:hypothetical protein [Thermoflexales bacterium]
MDIEHKLALAGQLIGVEPAEEVGAGGKPTPRDVEPYITHAALPGGKHITLLKTLLSSACERDCYYCACRAGRDCRR